MSTLIIGSEEGTTDTGLPGATPNFPFTSFLNAPYRRLAENRMALLSGQTPTYKPSWNDAMYSHKEIYDRNARNPQGHKCHFAYMADPITGKTVSPVLALIAGTSLPDLKTGRNLNLGPSSVSAKGGTAPSANGAWQINSPGATGVAVQAMPSCAPNVFPQPYVALNAATTVEGIRLYRFNATTWRISRVVASAETTELDIATTSQIDPPDSSVFGIRRDGTRLRAFVNGRMIADFTLSGAAQALAATAVAVQALTDTSIMDNVEIYNNL